MLSEFFERLLPLADTLRLSKAQADVPRAPLERLLKNTQHHHHEKSLPPTPPLVPPTQPILLPLPTPNTAPQHNWNAWQSPIRCKAPPFRTPTTNPPLPKIYPVAISLLVSVASDRFLASLLSQSKMDEGVIRTLLSVLEYRRQTAADQSERNAVEKYGYRSIPQISKEQ
jgi:hypothetical protein